MSEITRIPPSAPVQPTHPLRPSREAGREPRRQPPEKAPRGRRDPAEGEGNDTPDPEVPDLEPDGDTHPGSDRAGDPGPPATGGSRIDLRI